MPTGESNVGCVQAALMSETAIKSSLTKQRYGELVQLGLRASEELTKHGLVRSEYCEFGRIMEKIMQLE